MMMHRRATTATAVQPQQQQQQQQHAVVSRSSLQGGGSAVVVDGSHSYTTHSSSSDASSSAGSTASPPAASYKAVSLTGGPDRPPTSTGSSKFRKRRKVAASYNKKTRNKSFLSSWWSSLTENTENAREDDEESHHHARQHLHEAPAYPRGYSGNDGVTKTLLAGVGFLVILFIFVWLLVALFTSLFSGFQGENYYNRPRRFPPNFRNHFAPRGGPRRPGGGPTDLELAEPLPWNPIYRVPEAMEIVGDRTDEYAMLREAVDPLIPQDHHRSLTRVQELRPHSMIGLHSMDGHNSDQIVVPYNIHDCPEDPPPGYPYQWNLLQILKNWDPDDVKVPERIHQGLCVFNYTRDYDKAMRYRTAELPFIVENDPEVDRTVERWNMPHYMESMLGSVMHRAEKSDTNHFMYYIPVSPKKKRPAIFEKMNRATRGVYAPAGWTPPTAMLRMTFNEWLTYANRTDDESKLAPDAPHWYFRLIGCGLMGNHGDCDAGSSEYLFDELTFFQPKPGLYMVEPEEQKGIHCRFGMQGVIAENHFDASRNSIVVLKGSRRYILSHPNQCSKLALYPKGHPSARHSATDWSNPELETYPEFAQATANEVVLQAGQVLYLPTNWFHFIVSLDLNYQCNARSGVSNEYMPPIHQCGF